MPAVAWWRRPAAVDALIVVSVAVVLLFGSVRAAAAGQPETRQPLDALAYAMLIMVAVSFGLRRRSPAAVLAVSVAATGAYLALRYPYGPILLAAALAMFLVALAGPLRRSAIACGISVVAVVGAEATTARPGGAMAILQLAAWAGWLLLPWALGTVLRDRLEGITRDRAEERQRRLFEGRMQMAREVHDIIAHGLAVISMQAGAALHVLDRRPDQARVALEAIRGASRHSLDELRTTLAVFRPATDPEDRRAAAGLAQLDALVATTAGSGVAVTTQVVGEPRPLPAFPDIAAYRIVQESLTNVLRHSGATMATVRLAYLPDAVEVDVTDDGRGAPGSPTPRRGNGLAGMAERAAALGGILEAGPHRDGGWRVHARLPLGEPTT